MNEPIHHFIFILLSWVLVSALRMRHAHVALAAMGLAFVYIFAPMAALFILMVTAEAILLVHLLYRLKRSHPLRKYGTYLLLLNLLFVDFHELLLGFSIAVLAISFSTIRIFMTARNILAERKAFSMYNYWWIVVAAFYLPAVVIGPVFSGLLLRDQQAKGEWAVVKLRDHRMILQGLVLSSLVAVGFANLAESIPVSEGGHWLPLLFLARFLQLFSSFWGQSLIAEHSSRFFGYRLPVNFDRPWKARSIKEFWSRWHRSMANFVMQYIFLPLNLKGINPRLATILSFMFMGLWHNTSAGYLLWGVCHGACMAYWPDPEKSRLGRLLSGITGAVLTWAIVLSLSYMANYSQLA